MTSSFPDLELRLNAELDQLMATLRERRAQGTVIDITHLFHEMVEYFEVGEEAPSKTLALAVFAAVTVLRLLSAEEVHVEEMES